MINMGPLSLHIHKFLSEFGYFYKVKEFQNPDSGTVFLISGLSVGIQSQIVVDDREEYIIFGSYSKYSFELNEQFLLGMNHLNLSAGEGIAYYYCVEDSCIYTKLITIISGSYPNDYYLRNTLNHTVDSLKAALNALDGLKKGTWEPNYRNLSK